MATASKAPKPDDLPSDSLANPSLLPPGFEAGDSAELQSTSGTVSKARWMFRGGLVLLCLSATAAWFVVGASSPGEAAPANPESAVIVSIGPGATYGEAQVFLGDGTSGQPLSTEALQTALASALSSPGKTEVIIKASGGVYLGEVERVYQQAAAALPAGRSVRFQILPLKAD